MLEPVRKRRHSESTFVLDFWTHHHHNNSRTLGRAVDQGRFSLYENDWAEEGSKTTSSRLVRERIFEESCSRQVFFLHFIKLRNQRWAQVCLQYTKVKTGNFLVALILIFLTYLYSIWLGTQALTVQRKIRRLENTLNNLITRDGSRGSSRLKFINFLSLRVGFSFKNFLNILTRLSGFIFVNRQQKLARIAQLVNCYRQWSLLSLTFFHNNRLKCHENESSTFLERLLQCGSYF